MWEGMLSQILAGVAIAVVAYIGKVVKGWAAVEKEKVEIQKQDAVKKEAYEALEIGVNAVQQQVVDGMKAAVKDGKITKDEYGKLRDQAVSKAVEVASGPAIQIITGMAVGAIQNIIDSILQGNKKKAK